MERERIMKAPKNPSTQPRLFQVIDMEELVPPHHILRQINEAVDVSVIHDWVAPLYTEKTGRPAADPERLLRLMLLSYLFDHSERELYEILPMHAGYLWFCGLDFESVLHPDPHHPTLPDRTTLVKTRKRWRQHGIFDRLILRTRCEHVFAEGKECHGLDRARSRGLYAMEEQALLTAVVQNLKRLCRFRKKRGGTGSLACAKPELGAGSPARLPILWR